MSHSGLEVWLLYWKALRAKIANKDLYVNKLCPLVCLLMDCSLVPFTNAGFDYSRHNISPEILNLFLVVDLHAQQSADASANALWAIFRGATCQGHLWQSFLAAGSSDAMHEHQWYHDPAETAIQIVQKLPVPEAVPFLADPLL